jgi:hypothetical protein
VQQYHRIITGKAQSRKRTGRLTSGSWYGVDVTDERTFDLFATTRWITPEARPRLSSHRYNWLIDGNRRLADAEFILEISINTRSVLQLRVKFNYRLH